MRTLNLVCDSSHESYVLWKSRLFAAVGFFKSAALIFIIILLVELSNLYNVPRETRVATRIIATAVRVIKDFFGFGATGKP